LITNNPISTDTKALDPLLAAKSLYMIYRSKAEHASVVALKGISFDLDEGEFVAVVGSSGSGKTSLFQILGGVMRPTAGSVIFEGEDITKKTEENLTVFRRSKIGFVFQEGNLLSDLSAFDNVNQTMALNKMPFEKRRRRTKELLTSMGVYNRRNQRAHKLSGGERQRVAIARAMANEPKLILADEPTGNVDFKTSVHLLELFKELNRETGTTFMIATHSSHVASYANRSLELRDGLLIRQHGQDKEIDLSKLDMSRVVLMDSDNRIALPQNILDQVENSSALWAIEIQESRIQLTPFETLTKEIATSVTDEVKTHLCPVCGAKNPVSKQFCFSCGAKF